MIPSLTLISPSWPLRSQGSKNYTHFQTPIAILQSHKFSAKQPCHTRGQSTGTHGSQPYMAQGPSKRPRGRWAIWQPSELCHHTTMTSALSGILIRVIYQKHHECMKQVAHSAIISVTLTCVIQPLWQFYLLLISTIQKIWWRLAFFGKSFTGYLSQIGYSTRIAALFYSIYSEEPPVFLDQSSWRHSPKNGQRDSGTAKVTAQRQELIALMWGLLGSSAL